MKPEYWLVIPVDTPIKQNHRLGEGPNDTLIDKKIYQRLVGKLIYMSHTHLDIAFAVSVVNQSMHAPSETNMLVLQRILQYLKSALGIGFIFYKHDHLEVKGYMNVDWVEYVIDRRSTSRYYTFVGENSITWHSKKQSIMARSSTKAEFRTMAHDICEILWLKAFVKELGFGSRDPIKLYHDNKAAISITHYLVEHDLTKHVKVDKYFIKEKLTKGLALLF